MKLYGIGKTRWNRPYWLLQELGLEFEPVIIDPRLGEHRSPEYLKLNPQGKMPVLEDGDQVVCESGAICFYLAEKYAQSGLIPADASLRAEMYRWVFFTVTELEPHLQRIDCHTFLYPEEKRSPAAIELARADFCRAASVLNERMRGRKFVVGESLTLADIMLVYVLIWGRWEKLLESLGELDRYLDFMMQRPAFPENLKTAPVEH